MELAAFPSCPLLHGPSFLMETLDEESVRPPRPHCVLATLVTPTLGRRSAHNPSSSLGMLELCTGRSVGQSKPKYLCWLILGVLEGLSGRPQVPSGPSCRGISGILDRSASPMVQQHP